MVWQIEPGEDHRCAHKLGALHLARLSLQQRAQGRFRLPGTVVSLCNVFAQLEEPRDGLKDLLVANKSEGGCFAARPLLKINDASRQRQRSDRPVRVPDAPKDRIGSVDGDVTAPRKLRSSFAFENQLING